MGFPYADGRSVRATHHVRPDRLVPDAQEQDQPNLNPTRRRIAVAVSPCMMHRGEMSHANTIFDNSARAVGSAK